MKLKSLTAYLIILSVLSGGFVLGMLRTGQYGAFLVQGYMLLPAIAALITRAFFDPLRFSDLRFRVGRWSNVLKFWLFSLGISALVFAAYTLLGAGIWDLSGKVFLDRLAVQFTAVGKDLNTATPEGMTPEIMLWVYFIGGLTVFNLMPGLITGLGEELGWRGLLFPRLYAICPWAAFIIGGLLWFAWHLPLTLVTPQQADPQTQMILLPVLALGSICTFTYLAYVYIKTNSVLVTALAHIALNNAQGSFGYLFVLQNAVWANIGLTLVMLLVVVVLMVSGEFQVFVRCLGNSPAQSGIRRSN